MISLPRVFGFIGSMKFLIKIMPSRITPNNSMSYELFSAMNVLTILQRVSQNRTQFIKNNLNCKYGFWGVTVVITPC